MNNLINWFETIYIASKIYIEIIIIFLILLEISLNFIIYFSSR